MWELKLTVSGSFSILEKGLEGGGKNDPFKKWIIFSGRCLFAWDVFFSKKVPICSEEINFGRKYQNKWMDIQSHGHETLQDGFSCNITHLLSFMFTGELRMVKCFSL